MSQPPKLLDQVRELLRVKRYAWSTEKTYVQWIKRFILFQNKRHLHHDTRTSSIVAASPSAVRWTLFDVILDRRTI